MPGPVSPPTRRPESECWWIVYVKLIVGSGRGRPSFAAGVNGVDVGFEFEVRGKGEGEEEEGKGEGEWDGEGDGAVVNEPERVRGGE